MNLFDYVAANFDGEKAIFTSVEGVTSIENVRQIISSRPEFFESIAGKKISLICKSNVELAKWILLLDGLAQKISILPDIIEQSAQKLFLELVETDLIITDCGAVVEGMNSVDVDVFNSNNKDIGNELELKREFNSQWVLTTSGTTGHPKLVQHDLNSLLNTVKHSKHTDYRWGLLYDLQRFAGIQVYLQAIISGNMLIIPKRHSELQEKLEMFTKWKVNCISGTPTLWRKILMQPNSEKLNLKTITLGGEIADSGILRALRVEYPHSKIRHIYASTEAGAVFSVSDGQAGFPKSYLTEGASGVSLDISDKNTLLVKSNSQSNGYLGNDQLDVNESGYIDTGDLISIEKDRCYFLGRENGSINVGGNKVYPEQVENTIASFPGVLLASVAAKKNSIMGNLVQAKIVIHESINDHRGFIRQVKNHCKESLPSYMVPAFITVVESIDTSVSGKLQRNE